MLRICRFYFENDKAVEHNTMASEPNPMCTAASPPNVPKFWKVGNFTIEGSNGHELRSELFSRLVKIGVHISPVSSRPWTYRLEYVNGPNYLDIECYFWSIRPAFVAELHLMSGERFTWQRLWKDIVDKTHTIEKYQLPATTPQAMIKYLESGQCNPEFLSILGADVPDRLLVQFLDCSNLNVVRYAISMLKNPVDSEHFRFWARKKPRTYLETLICNSVHKLLSKKSRI